MKQGFLSAYFVGVAAKRLSAVEVRPLASNQHEFNGDRQLRKLLGAEHRAFPARFLYVGDTEEEFATADGSVTWYDAREAHPKRTEYRLYYPNTVVSERALEDDLLVIGKRSKDLLVLVAKKGSTSEAQVRWLFGLDLERRGGGFEVIEIKGARDAPLDLAARFILDELGVEVAPSTDFLGLVLHEFPSGFPATTAFSAFARRTIQEVSATDDPDGALSAWMDREELLFRAMERHLVVDRIKEGFGDDVDAFIGFSLSVQNRRKARAGLALENHTEEILRTNQVRFQRGVVTEGRSRPDFLFPGAKEYRDDSFPVERLAMLGAKSSCKERWHQVLTEANKIHTKHLLTLEPGISETLTGEMRRNRVQLVLPKNLHRTYSTPQQKWLMSVREFIGHVKSQQRIS